MRLNVRDLPLVGSSYNFVGSENGNVSISIFFVEAQPGSGARLHRHKYDEVVIVQEGNTRLVVADQVHEAGKGDVFVIKAGTPHGFVNIGDGALKQIDIHLHPRFEQEDLPATSIANNAGLPN